jgi:hypothetical protein
MLMSEALAATEHWSTTVPALVCSVAVATGLALPVALVSLVIALAVAVPVLAAPNAVALNDSVATTVPGAATVPVKRNASLPLAPISAVTASVAAFRAAVEWVTAILQFLQFFFVKVADQFDFLNFARCFASDLHCKPQLTRLSA